MLEPTSTTGTTFMALAIALLGPVLGPAIGPYALIVACALGGALWPLATMEVPSKVAGAWFLLRVVMSAVILTSTAAWWLESRYQVPAVHGMAVVAFFIGALGAAWRPVLEALGKALQSLAAGVGSFFNKNGGQP